MDALLLTEYMKLEMVQMDEPEIGPDDVLIRVRACGICGSDVHGLDGSTGRRIPPLVMGHEAAGMVEKAGANVRDLKRGDRVTFDSTIYCGHCAFCARGDVNLCDNRMVLGVSPGEYRRHGAFAEFVSVPRRIVYRLPDSLSFEQAALIEAASVAVHAVSLTPVRLGDTGVVVGSGMIGVLVVQSLRAAGCANVIVIDPVESRLQGSCASNGEYPAVIELMARGVIRVESLISAVAPLKEGADWFGKLYRREGNLMKVILQP